MPNWIKIRTEYETTGISQRKIAEKHGVSFNTLKDKANRESWARAKKETHNKITQQTQQKAISKEVNRNSRIASLADKLADKLEMAIEQIENYIVTNKTKIKTIEYDNSNKLMKPAKEIITETEIKDIVSGIVDKQGLKYLTAALKDIKDIQTEKINEGDKGKLDELIKALSVGGVPR